MKKLLSVLLICISVFLTACQSEADDGKREAVDATKVDWGFFVKNGNEEQINDIQVDGKTIENIKDYHHILNSIQKNKKLIHTKKDAGLVKVYVRFNKVGKNFQVYEVNEYDGKETTFYLEQSILKGY